MSFTVAQLDALDAAIATGATSFSYDGKSTSFRSLNDMLRVRNLIAMSLGLTKAKSTTVLAAHTSGFQPRTPDSAIYSNWPYP